MSRDKPDAKVTPEALQVILLDEIASRIGELAKYQRQDDTEGRMVPITLPVTDVLVDFGCNPPWHSFQAVNDGPNEMFLDVNTSYNAVSLNTPLLPGETLLVDYHKPRITIIYRRCAIGQTATLRLFGVW